jgi:hypothetical protein
MGALAVGALVLWEAMDQLVQVVLAVQDYLLQ